MTGKSGVLQIVSELLTLMRDQPTQGLNTITTIFQFMYGLVAQSCLCPGFSTLMINLISTRSYIPGTGEETDWKSDYAYGCDHEIYTVMISSDFTDMTFPEAAE